METEERPGNTQRGSRLSGAGSQAPSRWHESFHPSHPPGTAGPGTAMPQVASPGQLLGLSLPWLPVTTSSAQPVGRGTGPSLLHSVSLAALCSRGGVILFAPGARSAHSRYKISCFPTVRGPLMEIYIAPATCGTLDSVRGSRVGQWSLPVRVQMPRSAEPSHKTVCCRGHSCNMCAGSAGTAG